MIKVSVIVPVYNMERYLKRCLDSLVCQSLKEIEIIVVNDGSQDHSQDIIDSYVSKYSQIISLKKENGGLSDARNYALPYAKGEYIAYLDSDDYVDYDFLEKMYEATQYGQKKVVVCGYLQEWPDRCEHVIEKNYSSIYEYIARGEVVAWNKIYKRSWLNELNILFPKGLLYEDVEYFLKVMANIQDIYEIAFVEECLIHYIQRDDSITYTQTKRVDNIHDVVDHVIDYYQRFSIAYYQAMEYKMTKGFFGHFLMKYKHIGDKKLRKQLLKKHWIYVKNTFPYWQKNPALNKYASGFIKIYLKMMCLPIYKIICILPMK